MAEHSLGLIVPQGGAKSLDSRIVALGKYSHVIPEESNRSSHCKSRPLRLFRRC